MRREDKFVLSHRPYAVDMSSLHVEVGTGWKGEYGTGTIGAVWFRRKYGITAACIGELRNTQWDVPQNAEQFLAQYSDGRYGGDCRARWDGENFWAAGQDPEENVRFLALLRPMLENYPAAPPGYEGWYVF